MKRTRADSVEMAMRSAQAGKVPQPSNVPLEAEDLPFFDSVVSEFARAEWTAHQIELAAMLARTMCDLEREQRALRVEGSILKSERGTPVVNPRKTVVQMHAQSILSFRRSLALHARAQSGDNRDAGTRRAVMKSNEAGEADDLLARPN